MLFVVVVFMIVHLVEYYGIVERQGDELGCFLNLQIIYYGNGAIGYDSNSLMSSIQDLDMN